MAQAIRAMLSVTILAPLVMVAGAGSAGSANEPEFCQARDADSVKAPVIGPSVKGISVALQAKRISRGQNLYGRPLNNGDDSANYGPVYRIERYNGSGWEVDPSSPDGPWVKRSWALAPDRAGRCFRFSVPPDQPAGVYRLVIPVTVETVRAARTAVFRIEG